MKTYIALLRGINVGGHRPLKMEKLRQMFTMMGFENVSTHIQSGNVVFDAFPEDQQELANQIKYQIDATFGYDVPVIIRTTDDLKRIFTEFPFEGKEGWKGYISFLSNQPSRDQKKELQAQSSEIEKFSVHEKSVYSFVNKKAEEKPIFSNGFVEKQLGMSVTTRNLCTTQKIVALTEQ